MLNFLKDKVVLITGGTGSFGKAYVRYLLEHSEVKKIIVLSRDELKQYHMEKEIPDSRVRYFLGDVRDLARLQRAFHGVDIVIHAAALKQVPKLEYNPFEAVKTNILGTQNVIEAAVDQGVEKVLLVSTDKAAQPVNLYGSTKLCAEKLIVSGNVYAAGRTKFSCVRYGNVIGSRGSIVETLLGGKNTEKQKVYITDERMSRFWLTLDQACELVSFALEEMVGGELFIPKVPSMKIVDMFDALAPHASKEVVGIRPGEKIHEMLVTEQEARHAYDLGEYYVVVPEFVPQDRYVKYADAGEPLPDGFTFCSDNNDVWLTQEGFLALT
ncbi:MAG: UDP-N-acetylglucosamine 4,6-dehydratase (inverting) [Candidatus Magasanikbacteria bacterium CG10_big_fil_rev_8_21_14_0_10_43_6]|uniref:UDP-N-acetylglucosamine 4,6-dehydratase (Inverting) n=1 Tax=Candidatus Magasanikbacteria bacterium CG10_big_fil_rev_8_21_14_0_10_43_6 TaxID=1974650 RepID=A0A2M6W246_9BACT|nr:MAG: UDP-N-acetylglucosamine 4,6-dehydratase (inverting) [Candidatus Magasanikbacteria bacterium CG10_big_fil_rev_8_21_14_0_10_43_6]